MTWLIGIVVVGFLGGIVYLSSKSFEHEQPRENFLESLTKFVEGKKTPIDGRENSFQVEFDFEGQPFVYEDVETKGFRDHVYKVYLKAKSKSNLTLSFVEKTERLTVRTEIFMASKIPDEPIEREAKVQLPKDFKEFGVYTNDAVKVNQLLDNPKIFQIFREFKNVDNRGFHSVGLKIVEGVCVLEFHTTGTLKPSYQTIFRNVAKIEDYLDKLCVVTKGLNDLKDS